MTYNVNFGLGGDPRTLAAIRRAGAELVFLQETTPAWERALRRQLGDDYPHMAFRHFGGAGGLAVLSKHPFRDGGYIANLEGWFPAWRVIVRSPVGPLQVLQVHLRPPVSDGGSVLSGYFSTRGTRLKEIARFARRLNTRLPTLVLGDFNEDAGGRAIAHLKSKGMRSVLDEYQPDATTWRWTTSMGIEVTHTLDHIVYSEQLRPLDARVIHAGRSDHLPVVAIFERS